MLTWAILWFTYAMNKLGIKSDPQGLVALAMIGDIIIFWAVADGLKAVCHA